MSQKQDIIKKLSDKKTKYELHKYNIKHIWISWSVARWEDGINSDVDIIYESGVFDYQNLDSNRNRWPIWAYIYIQKNLNKKVDIMSKNDIKPRAKESLLSDMQYIW